jgi:hypothetical protein
LEVNECCEGCTNPEKNLYLLKPRKEILAEMRGFSFLREVSKGSMVFHSTPSCYDYRMEHNIEIIYGRYSSKLKLAIEIKKWEKEGYKVTTKLGANNSEIKVRFMQN